MSFCVLLRSFGASGDNAEQLKLIDSCSHRAESSSGAMLFDHFPAPRKQFLRRTLPEMMAAGVEGGIVMVLVEGYIDRKVSSTFSSASKT